MENALSLFQAYLKGRHLKVTPQRRFILNAFLHASGHPSTEDLYRRVQEDDPGIGQTTVYRTMKLLVAAGLAREVQFSDGVARYESVLGVSHHDHLICESCGTNLEVVDSRIEALQEDLAASHGFTLTSHKMCLYGLCPACRERHGKREPA